MRSYQPIQDLLCYTINGSLLLLVQLKTGYFWK